MFNEKEKTQYWSTMFGNGGIASLAGGFIAIATEQGNLFLDSLLILFGMASVLFGYLLLKD